MERVDIQHAPWSKVILSRLYEIMFLEPVEETVWFFDGNKISQEQFVQYFSSPSLALFLPVFQEQTVGMLWLDQIVQDHRARGHMYFFTKFRGKRTIPLREIGLRALAKARRVFNLQHVYFYVPEDHRRLLNFVLNTGVSFHGKLPGYFRHDGKSIDALIGYASVGVNYGECEPVHQPTETQ